MDRKRNAVFYADVHDFYGSSKQTEAQTRSEGSCPKKGCETARKKKIATPYANKAQIDSTKYVRAPGLREEGRISRYSEHDHTQRENDECDQRDRRHTIRRTIPMTWLRS